MKRSSSRSRLAASAWAEWSSFDPARAARAMQSGPTVNRFVLALVLFAPALIASSAPPPARTLTVWAWERPEDLRFLPRGVDVVYLASTVTLGRDVSVHPRAQPLRVPDHVTPRPVVRIEARQGASLSTLTSAQREELISALLGATRGGDWLQIDFDARESETDAY